MRQGQQDGESPCRVGAIEAMLAQARQQVPGCIIEKMLALLLVASKK